MYDALERQSRHGALRGQRVVALLLSAGSAAVVLRFGIDALALVAVALSILVVSYRYPLVIAGLAVLQSVDFFRFVPAQAIFAMQLGPGVQVNFLDVLVLVSLAFAILRLAGRRRRMVYGWPVIAILGVVFLNLALALAFGSTTLDAGLGFLRNMFYYTMYFVLVAAIDTPKKLEHWIRFIFAVMLVSVALQVVEAVAGRSLTLGLAQYYVYGAQQRISVGPGVNVLYLWNRATLFMVLALFLGLGALFDGGARTLRFGLISVLGFLSLVMAFVRQWYVYVMAGVAALLVMQKSKRTRSIGLLALGVMFLVVLLAAVGPAVSSAYGSSILGAWLLRVSTLTQFQAESSYYSRVAVASEQWRLFLASPIFGQGMTAQFGAVANSDVGVTNTLAEFGISGMLAILALVVAVPMRLLRLRRSLGPGAARGFAAGLIATWATMFAGYLYGVNFFTGAEGIWMTVLVVSLADRLEVFAESERLPLGATPGSG
jgi:hypothetical protein